MKSKKIATFIAALIMLATMTISASASVTFTNGNNWEFEVDMNNFHWGYETSEIYGWGSKGFQCFGMDAALGETGLPFEVLMNATGLILEVSAPPSGASSMAMHWLGDASLNIASFTGGSQFIGSEAPVGYHTYYDISTGKISLPFETSWSNHVYRNFRSNTSHAGVGIQYHPNLSALNVTRAYLYGNTAPCGDCSGFPCKCVFTTADALLVLRASAGLETLTPEQIARYDRNKDGEITTADAIAILRIAAGL
jgi:hypothetical protein